MIGRGLIYLLDCICEGLGIKIVKHVVEGSQPFDCVFVLGPALRRDECDDTLDGIAAEGKSSGEAGGRPAVIR